MVGLIFPTEAESGALVASMEGRLPVTIGKRECFRGRLSGREVFSLVSGIGQANAAQTVAALIERERPGLIMLGGCAGAYPGSGLRVGDAAAATEERYPELGVLTKDGLSDIESIGMPLVETGGVRYFGSMPLSAVYRDALDAASRESGVRLAHGVFLTVSAVTGTEARGAELARIHGALCENMEGAAAAQVSLHYGVPLIELRGISNIAGERDRAAWDIPAACESCAELIKAFLRTYRQ